LRRGVAQDNDGCVEEVEDEDEDEDEDGQRRQQRYEPPDTEVSPYEEESRTSCCCGGTTTLRILFPLFSLLLVSFFLALCSLLCMSFGPYSPLLTFSFGWSETIIPPTDRLYSSLSGDHDHDWEVPPAKRPRTHFPVVVCLCPCRARQRAIQKWTMWLL